MVREYRLLLQDDPSDDGTDSELCARCAHLPNAISLAVTAIYSANKEDRGCSSFLAKKLPHCERR
ncbi:hypothetical protein JOH51_001431 [Rhizobium leguminosarum]|nr:hypothetical protein [Rhizobium leguminosarum]